MTAILKDTGCQRQSHGGSPPGGGPCPRCGRPRCTAAAKTRAGERCRKNPHPGASICTNHGLTQVGRAAAAGRVADVEAGKVLAKLMTGDAEPITDPILALQRLTGQLQQVAEQIGKRLEDGDLDGPRERAWIRVVRELRLALDGMAGLGLVEQQIELERVRADRFVAAFRGSQLVLGLVPGDAQLQLRKYLELLDGVVPPALPPGEVVVA